MLHESKSFQKPFTGKAKRGSFLSLSGCSGQHLSISREGWIFAVNASTTVFLSFRTTSARSVTFLLMSSANYVTTTDLSKRRPI